MLRESAKDAEAFDRIRSRTPGVIAAELTALRSAARSR